MQVHGRIHGDMHVPKDCRGIAEGLPKGCRSAPQGVPKGPLRFPGVAHGLPRGLPWVVKGCGGSGWESRPTLRVREHVRGGCGRANYCAGGAAALVREISVRYM